MAAFAAAGATHGLHEGERGLACDATRSRPTNKAPPLTAVDMAFSGKAVMAMYAFAAIISSSGHVEQQQKAVVDMHAFAPGSVMLLMDELRNGPVRARVRLQRLLPIGNGRNRPPGASMF